MDCVLLCCFIMCIRYFSHFFFRCFTWFWFSIFLWKFFLFIVACDCSCPFCWYCWVEGIEAFGYLVSSKINSKLFPRRVFNCKIVQLGGTENSVYLDVLRLFAHGTWSDYKSKQMKSFLILFICIPFLYVQLVHVWGIVLCVTQQLVHVLIDINRNILLICLEIW